MLVMYPYLKRSSTIYKVNLYISVFPAEKWECVAPSYPLEVARGKPTHLSSTEDSWSSDKANDGNMGTDLFGAVCSVTVDNSGQGELNPWWVVNLEEKYSIHSVAITNRGDCCSKYTIFF